MACSLTTINSFPDSLTTSTTAVFIYASSQTPSTFQCNLDNPSFNACPVSYTGLADGGNIFQVRATDQAGNTDPTPAQYNWTVDTTAPILSLPANMTVEATGPSGADVSYSVTASDAVDPNPLLACTPASRAAFPLGVTQVDCTTTDASGNSSPGSFTVTVVDTTPPDTFISNPPSNPTNNTTANFTVTTTEPGAALECRLDGADYVACTSPVSYSNLGNGAHTFTVRATDFSGNTDLSPAEYTWIVNTIGPGVTIDSHPEDPTNTTSASFTFTVIAGGVGIAQTSCWIDGDVPSGCVSGTFKASLTQGSHTFQVSALDLSGNEATASYTWVVDTTPPIAQVTALPAFQTGLSFQVTWSGSDNLSGIANFDTQVQVDGAGWVDWLNNTLLTSSTHTGENGKAYAFRVRAVDQAGTTGDWSSSTNTTVDVTAPIAWMGTPQLVSGQAYQISWNGSDATSGVDHYQVEIQEQSGAWTTWQNNTPATSAQFNATPGIHYHFHVRSVDQAGNIGEWSQSVEVWYMFRLYLPFIRKNP